MIATMSITAIRRHVLLIGIDAYRSVSPLHGCVNDVDAIEAVLLDRLGVPAESITKLTAPHTSSARRPRRPEKEATSANIRTELTALAGEKVQRGDRVLILYCGHGTQLLHSGGRTFREALVPVDIDRGGDLLFDHELNLLLQGIVSRACDLTVILDCCCSAGVTRSSLRPPNTAARFCRIERAEVPLTPPRITRGPWARSTPRGLLGHLEPGDSGYLVAAAAQSNESANEDHCIDGKRRGAFSMALLEQIETTPVERLESLRWVDVWQAIRGKVSARFPGQNPILLGRPERRVFGGSFEPHDPGYPVVRDGERYRILAGELAGLTEGARVVVYKPIPPIIPPIDSPEERIARLGELCVETAHAAYSIARAVGRVPIDVVEGARGRMIAPGLQDELVVGLDPYDDDLARRLKAASFVRVVPKESAGIEVEDVYIGKTPDGMVWLGDEIYGPRAEGEEEAPLVQIPARDTTTLFEVLRHYARYNIPLRLVRRRHKRDGHAGPLRIAALDCLDMPPLAGHHLQDPPLKEAPLNPDEAYEYRLNAGHPVCFVIENGCSETIYANLINCAASGRVEILGDRQIQLLPDGKHVFWHAGHLGEPFVCSLPPGRLSGVDRLIAIASTDPGLNLSCLSVDESFADTVKKARRTRSGSRSKHDDTWVATMIPIKIIRRPIGAV